MSRHVNGKKGASGRTLNEQSNTRLPKRAAPFHALCGGAALMAKKRSRRRTQKSPGAKPAGGYERAVQLYEAGDLLRAEQTLRDLVKARPNQVEALVLLARVYAHLDAYDRADEQLQKAIELERGMPSCG